jgi:hypothetical protein
MNEDEMMWRQMKRPMDLLTAFCKGHIFDLGSSQYEVSAGLTDHALAIRVLSIAITGVG